MSYEREHLAQALDLLEQAIDREPRYGPALALAAAYRANVDNYDWADSRDEEENRRAPVDLAREALRAAADDPGVLGRAAMVPGRFGEDIDAALALIDRALVLNPLCLWLVLERLAAPVRWTGGTRDRAFRDLDAPQSARSEGVPFCRVGIAHFVSHRFEDALAALRISLEEVSAFLSRISRAGSLLRAYGPPRRSAIHPQAADSTHPGRCARLRTHSAVRRMASYFVRACAWRPARGNEPDPPS